MPQLRDIRSEEHTSELQSHHELVCRLLLEKKKRCTTSAATGSPGPAGIATRRSAATTPARATPTCTRLESATGSEKGRTGLFQGRRTKPPFSFQSGRRVHRRIMNFTPDGLAMTERPKRPVQAYRNPGFLNSKDARELRILAEYLEPKSRFDYHKVDDTIVFMGSARLKSREAAEEALRAAEAAGAGVEAARMALKMSVYYEAARGLAFRLTNWSKELDRKERRFVVCTGGGPGIMEAANRGASEAQGLNVGLTISIPDEEFDNPYVSRELHFYFHYFFMRKFWFVYLAKAVVLFPGGFGTLDEFFEMLTLVQTRKMRKRIPIVLFGTEYWDDIVDFGGLVKYGMISPGDLDLFHRTDSLDEAYDIITKGLTENALGSPRPAL